MAFFSLLIELGGSSGVSGILVLWVFEYLKLGMFRESGILLDLRFLGGLIMLCLKTRSLGGEKIPCSSLDSMS